MKTLKLQFPELSTVELLRWATLNGARFLGIEKEFGSITIGKRPGLNLITKVKGTEITAESEVQVLV